MRRESVSGFGFGSTRVGLIVLTLFAVGCGSLNAPLAVVEFVDINQYAGKWYEIARYPNSFEQGCVGVTADYALRDDGRISVLNTCIQDTLDGPVSTAEGTARAIDETNARLKVTFFWPFEGDYWIMELDEDYTYAVVGDPSRRFLWILSRTPQLDSDILDGILSRLPDQGFEPDRLIMVTQDVDGTEG